jgi:hypothetical protein
MDFERRLVILFEGRRKFLTRLRAIIPGGN